MQVHNAQRRHSVQGSMYDAVQFSQTEKAPANVVSNLKTHTEKKTLAWNTVAFHVKIYMI